MSAKASLPNSSIARNSLGPLARSPRDRNVCIGCDAIVHRCEDIPKSVRLTNPR